MSELNREQTIKVLECISRTEDVLCEGCTYRKYVGLACHRIGAKDALSLIEELTEENKRLRAPRFISYPDGTTELIPSVESVRADTVRKMHSEIKDRCIKGGIYPAFVKSTIDQIAKEMIGEGND